MKLHLILFSALASLLGPLATAQEKEAGEAKPSGLGKIQDTKKYHLKGGDEIQLIVYEEEELNKTTTLTSTGEASFELIGVINLNGLTLREACDKIEAAFTPDYLLKPKVTLDLIKSAAERVGVNGAVVSTGDVAIPESENLDILGAILRAGGLSKEADRSKIIVTRGKDRQIYHYDALSEAGAEPVFLLNHDTIDVGIHPHANKTVLVMGEVHSPMDIPYPLDSALTVGTAIGRCGGVKLTAYANGITILRSGKTLGIPNGSKTRLSPGDVLRVPVNPYIGKFVTVTGKVQSPGKVAFSTDGKLSIITAITLAGGRAPSGNMKKVAVLRLIKGQPKNYELNVYEMLKGKQALFYLQVGDIVSVTESRF